MSNTPGPYGWIARFVLTNRKMVAWVSVLLVIVSLLVGLPPKVDPNLLELLPRNEPTVNALRNLNEKEGGVSLITLAYESDDPELLRNTLEAMTQDLRKLERVDWVLHELDPELTRQIGLLQLDAAEVHQLNVRLKGALALGPALNPFVTQRLMAMGPLTERIQSLSDAPKLFGGGEGAGRILVRPIESAHNQPFAVAVMEDVEAIMKKHANPAVRSTWVGGSYRHNVEDYLGIKSDLLWTSFTSLGLVLIVMWISFRSPKTIFMVFIPLLSANAIVLAFVWLAMDSLNTYTSFGTAILIGLGIDFAVHLVGRYREIRRSGVEIEAAIIDAWDRTGPPCMTAALTSAAGFLALAAANFQGFAQLGVLLAVGLMLCLLSMLVLLPLLIPIFDPNPSSLLGGLAPPPRAEASRSTYRYAPGLLSIAVLLTGVVGAKSLPNLSWEYDFSSLRRNGLAYAELTEQQQKLVRESYSPMVVERSDLADLKQTEAKVREAQARGELPHVGRILSILDVLPEDQRERVAEIRALVELLESPNLRYLPGPLVSKLLPLKGMDMKVRSPTELPIPVQDLLGVRRGTGARLLLFPVGNMWDLRESSKLETELMTVLTPGAVAGDYVTLGALYRIVNHDMPIVGTLAVLMVFALTVIDLRKAHWVAAAMGTLFAGMVWAGWAVQVVGVKLSIINVVGVPILVGIGVDVVIHLLHRLKDEGPGGVRRAMRTTGVAASISTITTIASFASLTVAGNRGVRGLGLLVVFGLFAVFLSSAVLLPLAWAAGFKVTGRAPGDSGPDA